MRKFVCIVFVILLTFVRQARADITAVTCTVGDGTNGDSKCQKEDLNAECPDTGGTASNCACKTDYFISTDKAQCVQSIEEITCTPTDGNTKCETQDPNTECPTGSKTCKCKAEHFLSSDKKQCVQSIEEITCTHDVAGNTKCETQAQNSECHTDDSTCVCKTKYYLISDKKTCKQKITTIDCTPGDGNAGTSKCRGLDTHSECPVDSDKCVCKSGYKGTNSCTKVLTGQCTTQDDCIGTVVNSECSSSQCSCVAGYKDANDLCVKVLGEKCSVAGDCTGTVENSACSSEKKCKCEENYIEENAACNKVLGQACTGTVQGDCVSNAVCDQTCKCSPGFKDTNGLCAAESSANSAWMTTSMLVTSLMIFLPRFICG